MDKSAGCIVLLKNEGGNLVLLTHAAGNWRNKKMGIPKGLVEENEDLEKTALRETKEETGLNVKIINHDPITVDTNNKRVYGFISILPAEEYKKLNDKLVVQTVDKREIDYARFYPLERARQLIYSYQRPLLDVVDKM